MVLNPGSSSKDRKSNPDMCEGEGYGFLPWTAQATNDYCEVEAMAYLMNVYYHPGRESLLRGAWAGMSPRTSTPSALLHWVWRSRIRRSQPIKLFIPSERMRDLFTRWLTADSTPDLVKEIAGGDITFAPTLPTQYRPELAQ